MLQAAVLDLAEAAFARVEGPKPEAYLARMRGIVALRRRAARGNPGDAALAGGAPPR